MRIVLTGAGGFIGGRLRTALLDAGHELVCVTRSAHAAQGRCRWVAADFETWDAASWSRVLAGAECVINTVGIFREEGGASFERVHGSGARAVFDACVAAGVQRVVHFSALGADAQAVSAYQRSKHALDEYLLRLPLHTLIVQPSLVFGLEGTSARQFLALAALPLVPLPAGGEQRVQPVHIDDVVTAVCAWIDLPAAVDGQRRVPFVGPQALTLRQYLLALRRGLQLSTPMTIAVPASLMRVAAGIGDAMPNALLNRDAWAMLQRGNSGDASAITALLQRAPRPAEEFIPPQQAPLARRDALWLHALPLLRLSLAVVWLWTGIVSLGLYPASDSLALLAAAGVPAPLQSLALYGAATLDLLLGVLTLCPLRHTRWLWLAQALLIVAYTAIISMRLPDYWLHPYGPISKNLPMLAVLWLLWALSPRPRRAV